MHTTFFIVDFDRGLIYLFRLLPVLHMMLSLNQYVLRRAINGAVYVWLPIIKMARSSFLEEKYLW